MAKPRIYGMKASYTPNARTDLRYRKKIQRSQATTNHESPHPKTERASEKEK